MVRAERERPTLAGVLVSDDLSHLGSLQAEVLQEQPLVTLTHRAGWRALMQSCG